MADAHPAFLRTLAEACAVAPPIFAPGSPAARWLDAPATPDAAKLTPAHLASAVAININIFPARSFLRPTLPSADYPDDYVLLVQHHQADDLVFGFAYRAKEIGNDLGGLRKYRDTAAELSHCIPALELDDVGVDIDSALEYHVSRWVYDTKSNDFWLVQRCRDNNFLIARAGLNNGGIYRLEGISMTASGEVLAHTHAASACASCSLRDDVPTGECVCPPVYYVKDEDRALAHSSWNTISRRLTAEPRWQRRIFDKVFFRQGQVGESTLIPAPIVESMVCDAPNGIHTERLRTVFIDHMTGQLWGPFNALAAHVALSDGDDLALVGKPWGQQRKRSKKEQLLLEDKSSPDVSSEEGHWKYCDFCGASFVKQANLRRHLRDVHFQERQFACTVCDRTFSQKANRDRHIATVHEKQKAHSCPICSLRVSTRANLKRHMSSAHKGTAEALADQVANIVSSVPDNFELPTYAGMSCK
mmetsp:Transcript_45415/g.111375  ORF Transcript_45415/g.111375 Transcript_45415/m.111375 type:complete len:474 (-) Transcript_45415:73-1494(-)